MAVVLAATYAIVAQLEPNQSLKEPSPPVPAQGQPRFPLSQFDDQRLGTSIRLPMPTSPTQVEFLLVGSR